MTGTASAATATATALDVQNSTRPFVVTPTEENTPPNGGQTEKPGATAPVQPTWDRDAGLRRDWDRQEIRATLGTLAEATAATTVATRGVGASARARFRITPIAVRYKGDETWQSRTRLRRVIRERIQNFQGPATEPRLTSVGTVISVADGIARIYGLSGARYLELLEFPRTGPSASPSRSKRIRSPCRSWATIPSFVRMTRSAPLGASSSARGRRADWARGKSTRRATGRCRPHQHEPHPPGRARRAWCHHAPIGDGAGADGPEGH